MFIVCVVKIISVDKTWRTKLTILSVNNHSHTILPILNSKKQYGG